LYFGDRVVGKDEQPDRLLLCIIVSLQVVAGNMSREQRAGVDVRFKPTIRFGFFGVEKIRFSHDENRSVLDRNKNRLVQQLSVVRFGVRRKPKSMVSAPRHSGCAALNLSRSLAPSIAVLRRRQKPDACSAAQS
jgi:hypothetical protein